VTSVFCGADAVRLALGAAALAIVVSSAGAVEAPPPGASSCSGCHAKGAAVPALEGRPADEIESAMVAFRSGERPATVMTRIAKGFTAEEARAIAEWLAAQGGR
jgi:cytochrome c553